MQQGVLNVPNRTLYHGDNLDFMRALNSDSVHLIATDPPFNKGRDFHATPDSLAAGAKFQDRWSWDGDVHEEWKEQIQDDWPAVWFVIEAAEVSYGQDMGAFLCWLAVRVIEMHRILRDDGSLYLHCDHTAGAYIKTMLDAVFGKGNFRNEIAWCYTGPSNTIRWFPRKHDIIQFYVKDDKQAKFNRDAVRVPYKSLTYQHAEAGDTGIGGKLTPHNLQEYKDRGKVVEDWWDDITPVGRIKGERTGYPTQKPVALLERIIQASTNQGNVVFDPFCGCATTPVAAERTGRQWIGSDIWDEAHKTVLLRLYQNGLDPASEEAKMSLSELDEMGIGAGLLQRTITVPGGGVYYTKTIPTRTDDGRTGAPPLRVKMRGRAIDPESEDASAKWSNAKKKDFLVERTGGNICWGCGETFRHPVYLELDHINPRVGGGANSVYNRALLCGPCNGRKGARLTLVELRKQNKRDGFMVSEIEIPSIPIIQSS